MFSWWNRIQNNQWVKDVLYFFPIRLFLLHMQRNWILIVFWLILLGYVTQQLGKDYGIPFLFVFPEYLGDVNTYAYGILGFAFGGFVMAFNISSYIINSHRFPFLATLSKPFLKYCANNFVIPLIFLVIYFIEVIRFLYFSEFTPVGTIVFYLLSFLFGMTLFILVSLGYFFTFNKDLIRIFGIQPQDVEGKRKRKLRVVRLWPKLDAKQKERIFFSEDEWKVETYFKNWWTITRARGAEHYDRQMLMKVFQQNHINGAIFELIVFISLLGLGAFREIPFFKIPAGASFFLLFTMLLMLASAVHFILRQWSTLFFIALFVALNILSQKQAFNITNYAYGLDYANPIEYNPDAIQTASIERKTLQNDIQWHEGILGKWKTRVTGQRPSATKPKLVVINCSGGGLKAALWTFLCLQKTDSLTGGALLDHTFLITGSSGGMIGASYMRELYLQKSLGLLDGYYEPTYAQKIGADILNPVATTIALNDLFLRLQRFSEGRYSYPKDRAYAFERQLNENTDYLMDKRLADYQPYEAEGRIPLMIFSPTILNDGKQLIISPQPLSFMANNFPVGDDYNHPMLEAVEFSRMFEKQQALNLKFTSAIRMNATYPYILPVVSLPSTPSLEIMDAGLRDNYGMRTSIKYLLHLRSWIESNTSGVIIMKIHDSKDIDYKREYNPSLVDNLFSPFNGLVNNLNRIHTQENDQLFQLFSYLFKGKIEVVDFRLSETVKDMEISMSLHLTTREKRQILRSASHPRINQSMERLRILLSE